MVQILRLAHQASRLNLAFAVLDRHYQRHWAYRAPEIRGSFITHEDEYFVRLAYQEIDLPLPDRTKN
ncbi:MAG: hypothetical protein V1738_05015 [Patescibacteria group bacterium]